jgi:hypothetical protein
VIVSSTLRDQVIGSGLEFEERGAHELKGVPGEWRLLRRRLVVAAASLVERFVRNSWHTCRADSTHPIRACC